jgi:small-conductance mechanosensitive channel
VAISHLDGFRPGPRDASTHRPMFDTLNLEAWGRIGLLAVAATASAYLVYRLLRRVAFRLAGLSPFLLAIVRRVQRPLRLLLPLVALQVLWQGVPPEMPGIAAVEHLNAVLMITVLTWLATASIRGVADGILATHPSQVADNFEARRVQTRTRVLSRMASSTVMIVGIAFILMTFPKARQLGASLLASAGVAGLVVGLAARSVFSNLLAGLQIAMAQPIRIDDVLIVEGEWGRVEEITATYVVLNIWDERRLIIPLNWFIEHPFQNWTRRSAELLGSVILWLDYTMPVDPIRREAERLCGASPKWDKRVCVVQVTDTSERCMQVRVLVSAASSDQAWDLRCDVREGLIAYVARHYPEALPRLRTRVELPDGALRAGPPMAAEPQPPLAT